MVQFLIRCHDGNFAAPPDLLNLKQYRSGDALEKLINQMSKMTLNCNENSKSYNCCSSGIHHLKHTSFKLSPSRLHLSAKILMYSQVAVSNHSSPHRNVLQQRINLIQMLDFVNWLIDLHSLSTLAEATEESQWDRWRRYWPSESSSHSQEAKDLKTK
jgi:hypothetical protein